MKIKHLKEVTASVLATSYPALTDSSVVFAASGGQVQSKLAQAANAIQGILTGLVVLVGICVALFIIIKCTSDAGDPREKSRIYHAIGRVTELIVLAVVVIWLLSWVYSLFI